MRNGRGGPRLARTLLAASLAVAMVTSLWGPVLPSAEAEPVAATAARQAGLGSEPLLSC